MNRLGGLFPLSSRLWGFTQIVSDIPVHAQAIRRLAHELALGVDVTFEDVLRLYL